MTSSFHANSAGLSTQNFEARSERDYEDDRRLSHSAATPVQGGSRSQESVGLRQERNVPGSPPQSIAAGHDTTYSQMPSEASISDDDNAVTSDNRSPPGPNLSSAASDDGGSLGSNTRSDEQSSSVANAVDPPTGGFESEIELARLQKIVPSNPSAFRRLPTRIDFPQGIDLEVIKPVAEDQIEFAILMLQDQGEAQMSLEYIARWLQQQYPEVAYILVRCPNSNPRHVWAGSQRDQDFVATSRLLLVDIIKDSLIVKCGFKAKQIAIIGHGQGGSVALAAVSLWNSIQFAGIVSIGGAMSGRSRSPANGKAQTPALLLASQRQSEISSLFQIAKETFVHASHSISNDMQNLALELPSTLRTLLKPVTDFFAHRLRREEWIKQAVISFGEYLSSLVRLKY